MNLAMFDRPISSEEGDHIRTGGEVGRRLIE
jgi:hypothetical protein